MKRLLSILFSVLVVTLFTVSGGLTASATVTARTLPPNNEFLAFDCTGSAPVSALVNFDVSTGSGTIVGNPVMPTHNACAYAGTFDPVTQKVYWVATISTPGVTGGLTAYLMKGDPVTGVATDMGAIHGTGGWATPPVTGMAVNSAGKAYAISYESGNFLYELDLATQQLTNRKAVSSPVPNSKCLYAFAFNPKDGNFYVNCEDRYFYKLDVVTGTATLACTEPNGYWGSDGIGFDNNGIGWMDYGMPPNGQQPIGIMSFDISQPDCAVSNPSLVRSVAGISNWDSYAMAISYPSLNPSPSPTPTPSAPASEPTLAVTGIALQNGLVAGIGAGIALILGVGTLVWRVRRR